MEEALRESEERFKSLFDNAVLGIYRTTPDGQVLLVSSAKAIFSYSCPSAQAGPGAQAYIDGELRFTIPKTDCERSSSAPSAGLELLNNGQCLSGLIPHQ